MFYYSNDNYNSNLSASYTAGQSTMSAISVPLKVPTYLTFGFGTDKECVYVITGKTTNSLTGVSWVRGYNGNLDAQMTIACLNNEDFLNQVAGAVSTPETLSNNIYGSDGGGTDAYSISLESPPSAYEEGLVIFFKANTANTGGATININSLGDKDIKGNLGQVLGSGDISPGQIVGIVYDGTAFRMFNSESSLYYSNTDGSTVTFNRAVSKSHKVVLSGDRTLAVSNFMEGQLMAIDLTQDNSGNRIVTWFGGIKWADGVAPTLTVTGNKTDSFIIRCIGEGSYLGYVCGQNL